LLHRELRQRRLRSRGQQLQSNRRIVRGRFGLLFCNMLSWNMLASSSGRTVRK
jgi:hypothetical protein